MCSPAEDLSKDADKTNRDQRGLGEILPLTITDGVMFGCAEIAWINKARICPRLSNNCKLSCVLEMIIAEMLDMSALHTTHYTHTKTHTTKPIQKDIHTHTYIQSPFCHY